MKKALISTLLLFSGAAIFAQDSDTTHFHLGSETEILLVKTRDTASTKNSANRDSTGLKPMTKDPAYFSGIDLGVTVLTGSPDQFDLNGGSEVFETIPIKSLYWGFNLAQFWVPVYRQQGLFTGVGLSYQSLTFDNEDVFPMATKDTLVLATLEQPERTYKTKKFRSFQLHAPVLLGFNTSRYEKKNFHISAGVVGYLNLNTIYKTKWKEDGNTEKSKLNDDFHFEPLRIDAALRVGYRNITLFSQYGLTPLFDTDKAPDIRTLTVGVRVMAF